MILSNKRLIILCAFDASLTLQNCNDNTITPKRNVLPPAGGVSLGFSDTSDFTGRFESLRDSIIKNGFVLLEEGAIYSFPDGNLKATMKVSDISRWEWDGHDLSIPYYVLNMTYTDLGNMPELSLNGVDWYIKWPDGLVDTLFAKYTEDKYGPNDCNCQHPVQELKLNGVDYLQNTHDHDNGVYIFPYPQ